MVCLAVLLPGALLTLPCRIKSILTTIVVGDVTGDFFFFFGLHYSQSELLMYKCENLSHFINSGMGKQ